ncbi:MAG: riboflavin synthase [Candidatus Omnitrophica bacterium]|nr:riboflavin synthase [Candidatus Omnitrophota bacterium]
MFTGIISQTGIVKRFGKTGPAYRLEVESSNIPKDAAVGDSVAVNGACLTLIGTNPESMAFDVMEETVRRSTLSELKTGDTVNLEWSLKAGGTIGGHFVQGHVDCTGRIAGIKKSGGESSIEIEFPPEFERLIVEKGSIALDGISLTIGALQNNRFKVYIIPHTLKITSLGSKRAGDNVNLEFDILGKYAARFHESKDGKLTEKFLREKGF